MNLFGMKKQMRYSCAPKNREEKKCLFKVQMVK